MSPREQARYRKLIYAGLIILLFTGLVIYRQLGVVEGAADRYGISETNIGKTDLGGSAARFLLTSFRGLLICGLWWEAIDLQMKHEWHEMELIIKSLTKLQPHFRSTWEYQGWNLAYNVSVEFDRVQDKYFYVAEGIKWTTEGERINRSQLYDPDNPPSYRRVVGDPTLRGSIAFFIMNKMSVSDEINTYRCYFPLSCIPPKEWDPYAFRRDPQNLKDFKRDHPQLVQRIRILKHIPEEAEAHLDEELKSFTSGLFRPEFPSLYPEQLAGDGDLLLSRGAGLPKFPVWPTPDEGENVTPRLREALQRADRAPERPENHDSFEIARLWFEYSVAPLPPPSLDLSTLDADRKRLYRMPQRQVSLIFRSNPARAKAHMGARLAREGWFEESRTAWAEAFELWRDHGRDNGLYLDHEERRELEVRARRLARRFPEIAAGRATELPSHAANDEETKRDFEALKRLSYIDSRSSVGNYRHWQIASEVNMTQPAMQAWSHIYNAQTRYKSDLHPARAEYEKGLEIWRQLMVTGKGRGEILLGLSASGLNAGAILQSKPYFEPTPFGADKQAQEELQPLQDEYLNVRARCEAPKWLRAGCDLWQVTQMLSRQAASSGSFVGPVGCLPQPVVPLSLPDMERLLADVPGPLDPYLDEIMVLQRRASKPKPRPAEALAPRPRPASEEEEIMTPRAITPPRR